MSSGTSTAGAASKAMSSRLLTMKFMQRAAASSPVSSAPSMLDQPSAKRRKTRDSLPSRFDVDALADQRAIQTALIEEEAKRQVALERQSAEAGDTRWVLNFEQDRKASSVTTTALRIIQAGYASLDETSSLHEKPTDYDITIGDRPIVVGRRSFGKFNKAIEKQQDPSGNDASASESGEDNEGSGNESEGDSDNPIGAKALIRASQRETIQRALSERKAKKRAEKAESLKSGEQKKDIKLNTLSNLSNLTSLTGRQDTKCHRCGDLGHLQVLCPRNKRGHVDGDDGSPRKSRKLR